jgi:hypothetical protein
MTVPEAVQKHLVSFSDDDLREADPARIKSLQRALAPAGFQGLALACARKVEDSHFPALLFSAQKATRLATIEPYLDYLLVATPLGAGRAAATPYFPLKPKEKNPVPEKLPPPEPSDDDPSDVVLSSVTLFDAGRTLALPETGKVAVRVLAWDQRSNTVTTELDRADDDEPAAAGYVLDDALALHDAAGRDRSALLQSDQSPEIDQPGAALSLPPSWDPAAASFPIRGALRLSLDAGSLVEPRWRVPAEEDAPPRPAAGTLPAAIVNGAILLLRRGHRDPVKVDVTIPVYGEAKAGAEVTLFFAVDLQRALTRRPPADAYLVYFVTGEHTSAPYGITVV